MAQDRESPRWIASKIFSKIARENHEQIVVMEPKLAELESRARTGSQEALDQWGELHNDILMKCSVAIVFSAAAVEAYIYDYGARGISDNFVQKYMDKLELVPKWVVIPQLVRGREFPRGGPGD